jgi:uncharacterized protein YqgC (DUF456 family)
MGRDGVAGLAILALSLGLYAATFGIESNPLVPVSPAFYPRLVLGATAVLAAALLVIDVVAHRLGRARAGVSWRGANHALVAVEFAIFTAYALLLPYIGFRIATFIFIVAMQVSLRRPVGARAWAIVVAVAVVATLVVYYVFDLYLHVLLPRGRWIEL